MRPGATLATAAAEIDALWTTLSRDRPLTDVARRARVVPFLKTPNGAPTFLLPTLGVLTAMGVFVLMIACANIAGLVLVIGVAADVKYSRINESPRPYVYLPFLQTYRSSMILHTRGRGNDSCHAQWMMSSSTGLL